VGRRALDGRALDGCALDRCALDSQPLGRGRELGLTGLPDNPNV
jgi:hypothetical protein